MRFSRSAAALAVVAAAAAAQSLGTVSLPASLAEPGAQVEGVLNKDPTSTNAYLGFCEGPAVDAEGNLFFSSGGRILKATPDGKGSVFDASASGTNGLEFDPQGRLVSGQSGKIVRYPASGPKETWISDGGGAALGSVNDLSIAADGSILFTNFNDGHIFYRPASGPTQNFNIGNKPNGIEWIEEKKLVYLNLTGQKKVVKFAFDPAGGATLAAAAATATDFVTGVDGPDGLTVDAQGNVYVAENQQGNIKVFDPQGGLLGFIKVMSANTARSSILYNTTNCVFGGPENKTLFIAGDAGGYKVKLKVAGRLRPGTTGIAWPIRPVRKGSPAGMLPPLDALGRYAATGGRASPRGILFTSP